MRHEGCSLLLTLSACFVRVTSQLLTHQASMSSGLCHTVIARDLRLPVRPVPKGTCTTSSSNSQQSKCSLSIQHVPILPYLQPIYIYCLDIAFSDQALLVFSTQR